SEGSLLHLADIGRDYYLHSAKGYEQIYTIESADADDYDDFPCIDFRHVDELRCCYAALLVLREYLHDRANLLYLWKRISRRMHFKIMKVITVQSKTVEEAIQTGLKQLGVTEDRVKVNVLEQSSKGLFGLIGSREAKVELTLIPDPVEEALSLLREV